MRRFPCTPASLPLCASACFIVCFMASIMATVAVPSYAAPRTVVAFTEERETVEPSALQIQRSSTPRRQRRPTRRPPARLRYSDFEHASRSHLALDCASCHKVESVSRINVTEFPDHDACISCHRVQFFAAGARPQICTVCHTVVSPRNDARFQFPKPNVASDFTGIFPHDKHQYVIARVVPAHPQRSLPNGAQFVNASFTANQTAKQTASQTKSQTATPPRDPNEILDSCATCHATDRTERDAPADWIKDTATAGTFKTSPTGHASCFNCHWQEQKPVAFDCAGCHGIVAPGKNPNAATTRAAFMPDEDAMMIDASLQTRRRPRGRNNSSSGQSANADTNLKITASHSPDVWLERVSAKFRHDRANHREYGCTTCHTNILEAASLQNLAAEVPIATCNFCHAVTRKDLQNELTKLKADASFSCTYCHLPGVGNRDAPDSHYLIAGRAPDAPRSERQKSTAPKSE